MDYDILYKQVFFIGKYLDENIRIKWGVEMKKGMAVVIAMVLGINMVACTTNTVASSSSQIVSQSVTEEVSSAPVISSEEIVSSAESLPPLVESLQAPSYSVQDVTFEGIQFQLPENVKVSTDEQGVFYGFFEDGSFIALILEDAYQSESYYYGYAVGALNRGIEEVSSLCESSEFTDVQSAIFNGMKAYYTTGTMQGVLDISGANSGINYKTEIMVFSSSDSIYSISFCSVEENFEENNEYFEQMLSSITWE